MTMVKLKPITDTSWLVLTGNSEVRSGVLTQVKDSLVFMGTAGKIKFTDRQAVCDHFAVDVFKHVITSAPKAVPITHVGGYPTRVENPVPYDQSSDLPLYTKTESSGIHYAAGYYCILSDSTWRGAFCPKLTTLSEGQSYEGPFKTDMEMKFRLRSLGQITDAVLPDEA